MKLRIRLQPTATLADGPAASRKFAAGVASLLTPAAVGAYALGCWRLASDLNLTGEFAIERGLFSHWQVWIALGAAIQAGAITLGRYGRGSGSAPVA